MTKTYILRVFVIFLNLFLQRGRFIELFYELIKILENRFSESFCFLENFLWVNFLKVTNGRKTCTQFLYTSKMGFLVPNSQKPTNVRKKNCLSLNYLKNLKIKYFKTIRNIKIILYFSKNILLSCVSKTTSLFLSTTFNSTNFDRNTQFKPKARYLKD